MTILIKPSTYLTGLKLIPISVESRVFPGKQFCITPCLQLTQNGKTHGLKRITELLEIKLIQRRHLFLRNETDKSGALEAEHVLFLLLLFLYAAQQLEGFPPFIFNFRLQVTTSPCTEFNFSFDFQRRLKLMYDIGLDLIQYACL